MPICRTLHDFGSANFALCSIAHGGLASTICIHLVTDVCANAIASAHELVNRIKLGPVQVKAEYAGTTYWRYGASRMLAEKNMFSKTATRRTYFTWLHAALCPTLALLTSGAMAQSAPSGVPAASSAGSPASTPFKPNDPAPSKEQCVESHHEAQQSQNEDKLVRARELARTCTSLVCPGLIISDCARWLNDLDQRIPSVVFEVRVDGEPNLTALVIADGKRVEDWTRGESLRLDPGEHQFRFELAEHPPIIQNLLLAEGMRYRIVSVDFKTVNQPSPLPAKPAPAVPASPLTPLPASSERPVPVVVYPLLGLGAVGVGSFALFGLIGNSKRSNLESSCKPNCTDGALGPMRTSYLIGDISLGVGAASLITAGVLYFGRPEKPVATTVGFAALHGGAGAFVTYKF